MKFFIYSVYDPEVESFDSRLNISPLDPEQMAEQFKRAHIKMDEKDKAFMEGKKACFIGVFDDETAKVTQEKIAEIYYFHEEKKVESKGEEETDKKDA